VNTQLTPEATTFVTDYHLATLSTMARDDSIHVVAVGFTLENGVVRIITNDGSQKVRNIERDGRASVGQVEGAKWLSLSGTATVNRDAAAIAHAVELYAARYRQPRENPNRVVIEISVEKLMASAGLKA
jgi:PPOX class probable F420-dependent enzyme